MSRQQTPSDRRAGLESKILAALRAKSQSTFDLAKHLNVEQSTVYRLCRKLEGAKVVQSVLDPGARLLYCLDDGEVVTQSNYKRCSDQEHDIRSFVGKKRVWGLASSARASEPSTARSLRVTRSLS